MKRIVLGLTIILELVILVFFTIETIDYYDKKSKIDKDTEVQDYEDRISKIDDEININKGKAESIIKEKKSKIEELELWQKRKRNIEENF